MATVRLLNQDGSHYRDATIPDYASPPEALWSQHDGVFVNVAYPAIDQTNKAPVYKRAETYLIHDG